MPGSASLSANTRTDVGPADYLLFADRRPAGVAEAKPDSWGARLTTVELQSEGYANAKLKWLSRAEPLPFLYESTGQVTRFTSGRDPNPRSRGIFTFHRPERKILVSRLRKLWRARRPLNRSRLKTTAGGWDPLLEYRYCVY